MAHYRREGLNMAVSSRVNPNFPIPGVDNSSKGFRDNFSVIKNEIENLQSKAIVLSGEVSSQPTAIDSGSGPINVSTTGRVYRDSFTSSDLSAGVLTVNHNTGQQLVIVQISNNLNQVVTPDGVTLTNINSASVDLTSFGVIDGTWNVLVRG